MYGYSEEMRGFCHLACFINNEQIEALSIIETGKLQFLLALNW